MTALILSALITLIMPTMNEDGSTIPLDETLIAVVWNVKKPAPVNVELGLPGETLTVEVPDKYGTWYATAWNLNGEQSQDSGIFTKTKPQPVYTCGCHDKVIKYE